MLDDTELATARAGYPTALEQTRTAPRRTRAPRTVRPIDLDALAEARERREARHARELAELLAERTDLRGVYAPADLVADALSWSA